jgi:hypothetical protein
MGKLMLRYQKLLLIGSMLKATDSSFKGSSREIWEKYVRMSTF